MKAMKSHELLNFQERHPTRPEAIKSGEETATNPYFAETTLLRTFPKSLYMTPSAPASGATSVPYIKNHKSNPFWRLKQTTAVKSVYLKNDRRYFTLNPAPNPDQD